MADTRQPRMRVFAGPNGSGKSTVIKYIRNYKVNGQTVAFGYYINADDIGQALKHKSGYSFKQFDFQIDEAEFLQIVQDSGLINGCFIWDDFKRSYEIKGNKLFCIKIDEVERLAQIIADYLRKKLLKEKKQFSFETVFSHPSKLDIMREAIEAGYKVYLYFVSTESPEVNKFRVNARTAQGGHDVPEDKIESRYYRALELLHDAAQLSYQAYFFDNSDNGQDFKLFAHFKVTGGKKVWDEIVESDVPNWFKKYYSAKVLR